MLGQATRAAALVRTLNPGPTDPDLMAAFLDGRDEAAFAALVRRHGPLVRFVCRTILKDNATADDAFQATFIALYRKAAGLRQHPSLAGWLFGAARNSARQLRRAADRRARRDLRAGRPEQTSPPDLSWREACSVLHAGIDRLPECYREPLVLCYLQGLSRDEAARRLGWSLNEVRGRLERGRVRLRARLRKQGITLSAGVLGVLTADALPPALVRTTIAFARSARTSVLPVVPGLWKAGVAIGLAVSVVLGLALQEDGATAQSTAPGVPKKVDAIAPKSIAVAGIVVSPEGIGVGNTQVVVRRSDAMDERITVMTDADGRFVAIIPELAPDSALVAVARGGKFAAGWHTWTGPPPKEVRISLVDDDVPIQGRILDLEGKPLAGVTVRVDAVIAFPGSGPQAFVEWMTGTRSRPPQATYRGVPPGATASAVTAADGKFRLTGLGRDRVVSLHVSGPGIAHETIGVATVTRLADPGGSRPNKTYTATFDHLASPARLIRGTARDIDTGKPIAGLSVNGFGGAAIVKTDQDGKYELPGYKKGPRYIVYGSSADGSVYFPTMAEAADVAGLDPLTIDLRVRAGVPVRGRLKDAASGKPVAGTIRYWALAGNPNVTSIPVGEKAGEYYTLDVKAKPDGSFTIAALPGPGFLSVQTDGWYRAAREDPTGYAENVGGRSDHDQLAISVGGAALTTLYQDAYQGIRFLKIDPAKPPAEQVIELTPAEPIRGRFVDPDGQPLVGVTVRGLARTGDIGSAALATADFTARPPHPDRPRRLTYRHDGKKLVGTTIIAAGSAKAIELKLEPWATLTGRLLDADGKPIVRATIYAPAGAGRDGKTVDTLRLGTFFTDATGRFKIDGLLPGVAYELNYRELGPKGRGGPVTKEAGLKPGEERDLGEIKVPGQ